MPPISIPSEFAHSQIDHSQIDHSIFAKGPNYEYALVIGYKVCVSLTKTKFLTRTEDPENFYTSIRIPIGIHARFEIFPVIILNVIKHSYNIVETLGAVL